MEISFKEWLLREEGSLFGTKAGFGKNVPTPTSKGQEDASKNCAGFLGPCPGQGGGGGGAPGPGPAPAKMAKKSNKK
jgi:hypothetical protein